MQRWFANQSEHLTRRKVLMICATLAIVLSLCCCIPMAFFLSARRDPYFSNWELEIYAGIAFQPRFQVGVAWSTTHQDLWPHKPLFPTHFSIPWVAYPIRGEVIVPP